MKMLKIAAGFVFLASVVAALFFGIQYAHLTSENTSHKKEIAQLTDERDDLQKRNVSLESENKVYLQRNSELRAEYIDVQKELYKIRIENSSLQLNIEDLERQIKRINAPSASPDGSSPWERLEAAFNALKSGDLGAHWDFLNSEFKEKCPKERFIKLGWRPGGEQISFIAHATGHPYAVVWFSIKGAIRSQILIVENGQWFIYVGTLGC